MGLFGSIFGSSKKQQLVRRLLRSRVAIDPMAKKLGQTPSVVDSMGVIQLMGTPEATIVTCIESLAAGRARGLSEIAVAQKIASYRGLSRPTGTFDAFVQDVVMREYGHSGFLPLDHVDWCIREARLTYGI